MGDGSDQTADHPKWVRWVARHIRGLTAITVLIAGLFYAVTLAAKNWDELMAAIGLNENGKSAECNFAAMTQKEFGDKTAKELDECAKR